MSIGDSLQCGGPTRGECLPVATTPNGPADLNRPLYEDLTRDDRFHWPSRFVSHACKCTGNFYGFDCSQCKFGYTGATCDEKADMRIRKNIDSLSSDERAKFIDAVDKIKFKPSNWSAMKLSREVGFDAIDPGDNVTFHPVSVYDMHVYRHVYAARSSLQSDGTCLKFGNNIDSHTIDWGHFGPGFAPWHRLWMLLIERDLQEASGDPEMTIPYWNWAVEAETCPFCTPDFMGESNNTEGAQNEVRIHFSDSKK